MFKKVLAFVLVAVMAIALVACGSTPAADSGKTTEGNAAETTKAADAGKKEITIGLAMAGMSSAYLIPVAEYAKQEAEKNGVKLILMDAQWDAQKQADQIANLMAQKIDALILNPVDAKSSLPSLKKLQEAKIPVVNLNMKVDDLSIDYVATYVGASMQAEAEMAADMMAEALGNKGNIVIIEGAPGSDAQIYRTKSFQDQLAAKYPDIKVLGIANGGWDRAKAMAAAEDLLTKYPNIDGIYTHDDNMTIGAVEAAKAAKRADKIKFIGIGGSKAGIEAIKAGDMYGSVTQPPDWEGATSVQAAIDLVNGKDVKSWLRDPVEMIKKENVDNFKGLW
jgi:ABC-type sugar transport system substrate-binding protein